MVYLRTRLRIVSTLSTDILTISLNMSTFVEPAYDCSYKVKNMGSVFKEAKVVAAVKFCLHRRCLVEARQSKIEKFLSRSFASEVVVAFDDIAVVATVVVFVGVSSVIAVVCISVVVAAVEIDVDV